VQVLKVLIVEYSWKVRFLVKASNCLRQIVKDSLLPTLSYTGSKTKLDFQDSEKDDREDMRRIAEMQIIRLKVRIETVVLFLSRSLNILSASDLMQSTTETDESHIYYRMTTIWYVVRNLPEFSPCMVQNSLRGLSTADMCVHVPADVWNFGTVNKDKIPLLQWYHYASLRGLCRKNLLIYKSKKAENDLVRKIHRLQNAALIASASKLTSETPYSANDEIFDRLAFLAHELGLERLEDNVSTVTSLSKRRVKERDFTRKINPGYLSEDEEGYIDGPWEVHALSHHSRLMVLNLERYGPEDWRMLAQKAKEVAHYKNKLCHFINSEGTLVPC
jgi:hypothetical protein